jgi:signal transduction histidine kinase
MKLQTRSNIYYAIYSILIFSFAGLLLYALIRKIYYRQVDESINTERMIIEEEIERLDTVPDFTSLFGHRIEVSLYLKPVTRKLRYSDTTLYNRNKDAYLSYRHQLYRNNRRNGLGYSISIMKPMDELNKLSKLIYGLILVSFLLLQIVLISMNYLVNRRLWKPFFNTLSKLKEYNIETPSSLDLPNTRVAEFRQLNGILTSLSHKLKRDFFRMKEFTENLSHEINTMLAVIISKIELLLQNEDLAPEQIEHCKTIYQVSGNLSRLNNALQILAKIDNQYYISKEEVDITEIIHSQFAAFQDFIEEKNFEVSVNTNSKILLMNRSLADILVSNILSNAIKHNTQPGFIRLNMSDESLIIKNSTILSSVTSKGQFNRYKNRYIPDKSMGLGLAIIKRICRLNNFSLTRMHQAGIHILTIRFNQ